MKKKEPKKQAKAVVKKASAKKQSSSVSLTANDFIRELNTYQSQKELEKIQRYFKSEEGQYGAGDTFIGVRMGQVFALAKAFIDLPLKEVETLLESAVHEVRAGAVSILDFRARRKKITEEEKKELFNLYIKRHDRINNWDLVDRSAPYVVGGYLVDKPRDILYKLAKSKNIWERRTAIVSTFFFIRRGDVQDTFNIAELLVKDKEDLIHKAAGGWIRAAGAKDKKRLYDFLDRHAETMPRTMLRYAIEHLSKQERAHYLGLKKRA